jgi:acyl carrier protein
MSAPSTQVLQQSVRAVLQRRLGDAIDPVGIDEKLAEALGGRYDSLTALECITAVEEEFGVEVDFVAHDVRHWFSTIALMAQFVHDELEDRAVLGERR